MIFPWDSIDIKQQSCRKSSFRLSRNNIAMSASKWATITPLKGHFCKFRNPKVSNFWFISSSSKMSLDLISLWIIGGEPSSCRYAIPFASPRAILYLWYKSLIRLWSAWNKLPFGMYLNTRKLDPPLSKLA